MTYSLDSFGPEFWQIPGEPGVRYPGSPLKSVEQALWEMKAGRWRLKPFFHIVAHEMSVSVLFWQ
jgi:hypothetical protein